MGTKDMRFLRVKASGFSSLAHGVEVGARDFMTMPFLTLDLILFVVSEHCSTLNFCDLENLGDSISYKTKKNLKKEFPLVFILDISSFVVL